MIILILNFRSWKYKCSGGDFDDVIEWRHWWPFFSICWYIHIYSCASFAIVNDTRLKYLVVGSHSEVTVLVSSFRHSFVASQLQNKVQGNFARLQLHLMVLQGPSPLQLHLINFMTLCGAKGVPSGTVVGRSVLEDSSRIYPYSWGSRLGGSSEVQCFQIFVWRWARLTFSTNASVDGGSVWILGAVAAPFPNLVVHSLYLMADIVFSLTLLL